MLNQTAAGITTWTQTAVFARSRLPARAPPSRRRQKGVKEGVILIPVALLKIRVKQLVKEGKATLTVGGDDDTSEIVLIPIKEIHGIF